jgi:hypothetical protein
MAHQFTSDHPEKLQGVWFKPNGRRYCTWMFDHSTSTLLAKRGAITRATRIDPKLSTNELKSTLPKLALDLSHNEAAAEHVTH